MSPNHYLDDVENFQTKIGTKADILFRQRPNVAPLYVSRSLVESEKGGKQVKCVRNQEVQALSDITQLQKNRADFCQIFTVRQRSSWSSIDTSREVFEGLMNIYGIYPQFWKCALTFGIKEVENEFEFPPFRSRHTRPNQPTHRDIHESSYMLRRVEFNGRKSASDPNAWSIRQTAVYHQFQVETQSHEADRLCSIRDNKSIFLFIAPSKNAEQHICQLLEGSQLSPWDLQRLLVADTLKGWSDYMACLNAELDKQSERIVAADVGPKTENLPALTDIYITFEDRQELKKLQNFIHDIKLILPATLQTLKRIREQCEKIYSRNTMTTNEKMSFDMTMEEFDEYIVEAELYVDRAAALEDRARSTTKLMSDLLSYEEAVALKELAKESHKEGESMHKLTISSHRLTARSTKDASAMKILTIITLIYLPTTIVANFFSTQFVQKGDNGQMQVATNVWLLAAISIPLTAFTLLVWWGCAFFTKVEDQPSEEHTLSVEQQSYPIILRRGSNLRNLIPSVRKKKPQNDEESGQAPGSPTPPSPSHTFRSDATTVKGG